MNRSRSKWRKYQEGRTQVQKCPVGEGREEGVGVEFSLCWTAAVTSKLRNSQPPSWKVEKSYLSLCFLEQCTFCFTSRGFILDLNKYLILGSPQLFFTWTTPMAFVPAFFIKVVFRTNLLSVDGQVSLCWIRSLYSYVGPFSMASLRSFDLSREGKELRIRMNSGDINVAWLSRDFQVSKLNLEPSNSLIFKLWTSL